MAKGSASADAGLLAAAEVADTGNFVDRFELARRLAVHERTVRRMVERGELPKPCLSAGGRPRWLWGHVPAFRVSAHAFLTAITRRRQ